MGDWGISEIGELKRGTRRKTTKRLCHKRHDEAANASATSNEGPNPPSEASADDLDLLRGVKGEDGQVVGWLANDRREDGLERRQCPVARKELVDAFVDRRGRRMCPSAPLSTRLRGKGWKRISSGCGSSIYGLSVDIGRAYLAERRSVVGVRRAETRCSPCRRRSQQIQPAHLGTSIEPEELAPGKPDTVASTAAASMPMLLTMSAAASTLGSCAPPPAEPGGGPSAI